MRGLGATATRYMQMQLILKHSEREKCFAPRSVLFYALLILKKKKKKLKDLVFL